MADRNGKGRRWARVVSAVLFGIDTLALLGLLLAVVGGVGDGAAILTAFLTALLLWLVGLAAIVHLFSRESAPFYEMRPAPEK
jgi:ABC-type proline/glycine betaine transport system permease subunit